MHHRFHRRTERDIILAVSSALLLMGYSAAQTDTQEIYIRDVDGTVTTGPVAGFLPAVWNGSPEERLAVAQDCDDLVWELSNIFNESDETVQSLTSVLDAEPDAWIRFTCLETLLDSSEDPTLAPLVVHFLAKGRPADAWPTVSWLARNQAQGALPHLQALWPAMGRPWLRPLLVLALANHGSTEHIGEFHRLVEDEHLYTFIQEHLSRSGNSSDQEYPYGGKGMSHETWLAPALRVTPDRGRSLRCWAGPGLIQPWRHERALRMPSGVRVSAAAVFDGSDGVLIQEINPDCWLPWEQLTWRPLDPEERDRQFFWGPLSSATEFDLPADESRSGTARRLRDAGLLELFDPGPEVIGAALVIDENRPELRDLLLFLSEAGDAPLLQKALAAVWGELEDQEQDER